MDLHKKEILVTGSEGFIGSHLVERLLTAGHKVKAFILYNSNNNWGWLETLAPHLKQNLNVFAGDIRDLTCLKAAMADCQVVFHLAALIAIPYSYRSPESYLETNIKGTLNVLQAAKELNVEKVIHTSTSEVYGSARFVPIHEDHPLCGQSPYSASKIGADQMALAFHYSYGLPVCILRPFNTYGPRQSARAIIPTIVSQIVNGAKSIKLGATHTTRDFNYIDDTVNGFLLAAQSDQSCGEVINLGTGYEVSIKDLVSMISLIMDRPMTIISDEQRMRPKKSEVERLCADNTKARQLLDWMPNFSGEEGLKAGLEKTIAWFSNQENLKYYKAQMYNV